MITLFHAHYHYLNPGPRVLFPELEALGVRVVDVTPLAVERVRALAAASSTLLIDQSVYNAATWADPRAFTLYHIVNQRPRAFYGEVLEALLAAPAARVFLSYFDLHDLKNQALLETLAGRVDALTWMFEKRPLAVAEVPPAHVDPWLTPAYDPLAVWQRARELFPVRIELPFALAAGELLPAGLPPRWDVCVAGAPYRTRALARASVRRAGLRLAPFRPASLAVAAANRVLPRALGVARATRASIALQQRLQATLVRRSAANFVCGGPLAFPVRKFFEIPAARSLLIAHPCVGLEDYGFRDGVNALFAAPDQAGPAARGVLRQPALRRRLVEAAAGTVAELHSAARRAADLVSCVRLLEEGRLAGAEFVAGRFELRQQAALSVAG